MDHAKLQAKAANGVFAVPCKLTVVHAMAPVPCAADHVHIA